VPELPEVEVVRLGLQAAITGASITRVQVVDDRSLKRHDCLRGRFVDMLTGVRVFSAERRGKFLWFPLSTGDALVVHLGMSGQLLLRTPRGESDTHVRVRLITEHPQHGEFAVTFVDQRVFGSMAVDALVACSDGYPTGDGTLAIPSQVAHIARDPLDPHFDEGEFAKALARRRSGIKRALLDQTLISGIGNIYADEALWAAELHYDQPACALSKRRIESVLAEVRRTFCAALDHGGTSFDRQYVNVNGASGYFSRHLAVYGRQGEPCGRCGTLIVRAPFMNRSSHFCPQCQRIRLLRVP
jgi:formamidopyrimidine-DNA glycosylase